MRLAQDSTNPVTPALAPGSAQSTILPLPPVSSPLPGPNEPMTFPIDPSSSSSSPGAAEAGPSRLQDPAPTPAQVAKRPLPPHMHAEHAHAHALSHGDKEHVAEGTRTPRPKLLTPSPPGSRRGSAAGAVDAESGVAVPGRLPGEGDLAVLMRTIDFAARKHSCQRRKDVDQTPYINHPIGVSNFLSSTGVTDVRVLQAAVLHDTVEDTHTTLQEIADNFGPDVARIVDECTDNPNLSSQSRKAEQIRTAPYKSKEAQQVKLADKLHNLESIRRCPPVGWTKRRIQAYFVWAKQVTDICSASHPPLGDLLSKLYKTAYTRVDGEYFPCHPNECGPFTEEEKDRIDKRLNGLKRGEKVCPNPIFF